MSYGNDISPIRTGLVIGTTILGIFLVYKIGDKLGIFPNFGEEMLGRQDALTSNLYHKYPNNVTITAQAGLDAANNMFYAKGFLWDDERSVIGIIQSLNTKVNLSFVSYIFQNQYSTSLATYLQTFIEDHQYKDINRIIRNMKTK